MDQADIIRYLNNMFRFMDQLVETEDIFETYDCENKHYIIEIKSRDKYYDPWLIEKQKLISNLQKAKKQNKDFIYLTEYRTKIITWNINNLISIDYDFKWQQKLMPETTVFTDRDKVVKDVGYLYEKYAKKY